jgi:SnoaL-like polyketide cyclase
MQNKTKNHHIIVAYFAIISLISCTTNKKADINNGQKTIDSLRSQIAELTAGNEIIAKHLVTFDTLDYTVFSKQEWARLHESHAQNIKVNWPDGHFTTGIDRHIADLKALFVYAPNTAIKQHPIRFGSGEMTCVIGIMTGSFTLPMPTGEGKFIKPTGKSFSLPMCTVGIWKDGVMVEEYLYWDNKTYMTQIGL